MIDLPKNFQKRREEEMKRKVKEAKERLDEWLEENNIFVGATIHYTPTGIIPEVMVLPREFLQENPEEKK